MTVEKTVFDLYDEMTVDTFLRVKLGSKWVTYIIPSNRQDKSIRTYGDVYLYYTTQKSNFRFAMGFVLEETLCGNFWKGENQYLYFDKGRPPELLESVRKIKSPLYFPKRSWEI